MRRFQMTLAFFAVFGAAVTADALLTIGDFSVVAVKWNNGETVTNTPNGVLATPQPINDGAVNLMLFNNDFPLYIDGPYAAGLIAFGLADQNAWTPADGDGNDLAESFAAIGDRVYVLVTQTGQTSLISQAEFTSGVVVAATSVTLDVDKAWVLEIDPTIDWATVSYGGVVVAQGNPFTGSSNAALRINVKTDFVISVICGGFDEDTGYATLNDVSSFPPLIFMDGFESGNTTAWSNTVP